MAFLAFIFVLVMLAALAGIIKPYYRDWGRKRFALIAFGALVMSMIVAPEPTPEQKAAMAAEAQAEAERDAVEQARQAEEDAEANIEVARTMLASEAKRIIKDAARNPDSVEFEFVGVSDDLSLVCIEYRAQNGFGGMNRETVAFKDGNPQESASFWNSNCAGVSLHEQSNW